MSLGRSQDGCALRRKLVDGLPNNELPVDENPLKSPTFSRNVHEHFTWLNDSQLRRAIVDGVRSDWTCVRVLFDRGGDTSAIWN